MGKEEIILIIVTGTFVLGLFCLAIILFVLYYMKRRKLHQSELEGAVLKTELLTIEKASQEISRELHDNIAQHLSVACIILQEPDLKVDNQKRAFQLVDDSIEELRRVSRMLTAHHIQEVRLADALNQEVELYSGRIKAKINFEKTGEERQLSHDQQLMILRIAQEAISNAVKHSGATAIDIHLGYSDHITTLSIKDNGKGFDNDKSLSANGLYNMHQRAAFINAELQIITAPGKGTEIRVVVGD